MNSIGKMSIIGGKKVAAVVDPYALPASVPAPLARWVFSNPANIIGNISNKITTLVDITGNGYDATSVVLNNQLDVTGDIASGKMPIPPLLVAGTSHTHIVWADNPLLSLTPIDNTIFSWYENNHIRVKTDAATVVGIYTSSGYYVIPKSAIPSTSSIKVMLILKSEYISPTTQTQSAYIITDNGSIFQTAPPLPQYPAGVRDMNIKYIGENLYPKAGFKVYDISVVGSLMTDQQILDYYNATKGLYGL